MSTLAAEPKLRELGATNVRFTSSMVYVSLSDAREIGLPLTHPDLRWLSEASPEQRKRWTIAPGGWAVLWEELGEGIEVEHLLMHQPIG